MTTINSIGTIVKKENGKEKNGLILTSF